MSADPNRIQEELEATFDRSQVKQRQGYDYVEVQSVIQRLNEVLGYDGWSFAITDRHETDRTLMVWGELTVNTENGTVSRMQCGRKNISFRKNSDVHLDIGNDWKSAASDCLKKCATLIGVGLSLSENDNRGGSDSGSNKQSNNPPPPPPREESSPTSPTEPGSASDEVMEMRKQVHKLEAKVLAMDGGTRNDMRTKMLKSLNLPINMNGLVDYQTTLEDLLAEGKDA